MSHRYNCSYINGTWYQRADGEAHQVYNPVDGTPVATVSLGTAEDAAHAVAAARDAFDSWSQTSSAERTRYLLAIRAGLEARGEELAQAITREVGTPIAFSRRAQVGSRSPRSWRSSATLLNRLVIRRSSMSQSESSRASRHGTIRCIRSRRRSRTRSQRAAR
jgi:acyl-CoA reductase-like NAD-dependent aldehyde dehydrogenase